LPSVTGGILQNGSYDVVNFALDHWLKSMKEDLQEPSVKQEFSEMETGEKLKFGIKTRLKLMTPYIDVWP
jgi:hypothetical protein